MMLFALQCTFVLIITQTCSKNVLTVKQIWLLLLLTFCQRSRVQETLPFLPPQPEKYDRCRGEGLALWKVCFSYFNNTSFILLMDGFQRTETSFGKVTNYIWYSLLNNQMHSQHLLTENTTWWVKSSSVYKGLQMYLRWCGLRVLPILILAKGWI